MKSELRGSLVILVQSARRVKPFQVLAYCS